MTNKQKILFVVLNWNGSQDTLDCCESIEKLKTSAQYEVETLIIDNNSGEDSFNYLCAGMKEKFGEPENLILSRDIKTKYELLIGLTYGKFHLFRSKVNHGFARGCNLGAKYAEKEEYELMLFLNNDTIVESDFLEPLIYSIDNNDVVIPQIRYYKNKNIIWNCGGKISRFGSRKYFFAGKNIDAVEFPSLVFPISFATGCCILFRTRYFHKIGGFTEKFFFGEEDVELALRLSKLKSKIVCNTNSIIYHKVGSSIKGDREKLLRKAYIHYLNRCINMKLQLGRGWGFWLIPSIVKIMLNLFIINHVSIRECFNFLRALILDSMKLIEVNKDKFESVLKHGIK